MRWREFQQVDVFTETPYLGNPVAVVMDGSDLTDAQMQTFARWTNLSETTFLLPPTEAGRAQGAHYRLRIFTPATELPFAGHPTLGTAHAWLRAQDAASRPQPSDTLVQECAGGLITVRIGAGQLAFAAPPRLRSGPLEEDEVELIARGLGLQRAEILGHAWCDNGPKWRAVRLASSRQVLALRPDAALLAGLYTGVVGPREGRAPVWGKVGVVAPVPATGQTTAAHRATDFEVRAFFPSAAGLAEDPVTGSLQAALAQWLMEEGLAPRRYVASQGTALGREGRVHLEAEGDRVWVGGACVTCIQGRVEL